MFREGIPVETIYFSGHPNILATHGNTLEVTRVEEISKRADCIIGVNATKSCLDLSSELKEHIQSSGDLAFEIIVNDMRFKFTGKGRRELVLSDPHEMVFRRSDFVSPRTAAISCDAAAIDLPRKMVELLQEPKSIGRLTIRALQSVDKEPQFPTFLES